MIDTETVSDARRFARLRYDGGYIGAGVSAPSPDLALKSGDIEVTIDRMGREAIVIPDAIARYMQAQIQEGWREFRGLATGESRKFTAATHMYDLTAAIVEVYAASDVPGNWTEDRRQQATLWREFAARYGTHCYASFVGRSDWDAPEHWWVDYPANRDLHLPGSPSRTTHAGLPAYMWAG